MLMLKECTKGKLNNSEIKLGRKSQKNKNLNTKKIKIIRNNMLPFITSIMKTVKDVK